MRRVRSDIKQLFYDAQMMNKDFARLQNPFAYMSAKKPNKGRPAKPIPYWITMKALLVLMLVGCSAPTPATDVTVLRASLKVDKVKCAVYIVDSKYPRDAAVSEDCGRLVGR